jgi:hypothetical protein
MAFTYTVTDNQIEGHKRVVRGTYTNTGGDTGGEVITGFSTVQHMQLQPIGAAAIATQSVVNETLPVSNPTGSMTIVTSADESGIWEAKGI